MFNELSSWDRKSFIEQHSDLIDVPSIDDMEDDEIIAAVENLGLVDINYLSSYDLMDVIEDKFWTFGDDEIKRLKELIDEK